MLWYNLAMKYKKYIGATLIGSLALVGGVSAYQLYPRQETIQPLATVETIAETEEEVVKPVNKPTEVTNPAPLPASEPVVQPAPAPRSSETPFNSEAFTRAVLPMIAKSNTTGSSNVTNESVYVFIKKTYDANPAPFVPSALQSIVDKCVNDLLQKHAAMIGEPLAYMRYKAQNICPL